MVGLDQGYRERMACLYGYIWDEYKKRNMGGRSDMRLSRSGTGCTMNAKYLKIYDGWNAANNRFIWFDSDYFTSIEGRKIKITE